ncbi:MAG: OB-fold nucleic acid binding domain-containing protein, partial [Candidatus Nanopelagicales bacterium]|nr:OB-fold nucleic acid binding domain-containing protein [Candidatus Nanopelagicales bacterium]
GLAQIHGDAVDIAVETKRAQAVGQFDLFGGEAAGVGIGMDLAIPDGEWDKSVLLAAEREMLGLYVSDHPLQGIEMALNQLTDCSIASLIIDQGADGRVVTIGGLVTEVNRKLTRAGKSWAIVTLEDMAASLEVLMFPKMYEKVAARVVDDAVLLVKGRVEQREDEPNRFVAMEVTVPDLSEGDAGPLTISITANRLVPPVISRLSHILSTHPGASEVRLQVEDGTRITLLRLDDARRVAVGPSLYADLKALLGPGCLVGSVAS